ncbi:MAG: helix-turn-helix domain-containing protein, partial [Spirochaetota bacterium]
PLTSYLGEKRIAFASYLLTETGSLGIEEISSICGYNNRIHFTRTFKQRRGLTPSEFRRQGIGAAEAQSDSAAGSA